MDSFTNPLPLFITGFPLTLGGEAKMVSRNERYPKQETNDSPWLVESTDYEEKSRFTGSPREKLELAKTLVAFANKEGGKVRIKRLEASSDLLDSARLDDMVNRFVAPRVGGITSGERSDGGWQISVPESRIKPHVFVREGSYVDEKGRNRTAFYPGQVYARHSSKTEPATDDDLRSIIQQHKADLLKQVAGAIGDLSIRMRGGSGSLPVRLSEADEALTITVEDPNRSYPYTAKTLGREIGKHQSWVGRAASLVGLKEDTLYCLAIQGAGNEVVVYRYNDRALEELRARAKDPDFDPYHPEG